jgi:hypothetical protein
MHHLSALQKSPAATWQHQKIDCRGDDYRGKGSGATAFKLINFNRPGYQLRGNFRGRQRIRRPERLPERCVSRAPGTQKRQQKPKRRPVDTPKIATTKRASVDAFAIHRASRANRRSRFGQLLQLRINTTAQHEMSMNNCSGGPKKANTATPAAEPTPLSSFAVLIAIALPRTPNSIPEQGRMPPGHPFLRRLGCPIRANYLLFT